MDEHVRTYLEGHHAAAMATLRPDGTPHIVRVGVALVDGKLWSSGTQTRKRTGHLRRDARSTLFVFDEQWRWLTLECRVTILDGADAPHLNLRLFQVMQGLPATGESGRITWFGAERTVDDFLQIMVEERRLIYQFNVQRSYGMYGDAPAG